MQTEENLIFLVKMAVKFRNLQISKIFNTNTNRIFQIPCKFSNVNKLYRTAAAWVKQICVNLKSIVNNRKTTILLKSFLKPFELRQAENDWIKINQEKIQDNTLKYIKRKLNIIVDNKNLLRCEERLQYAPLLYDSKTPILLNDKH